MLYRTNECERIRIIFLSFRTQLQVSAPQMILLFEQFVLSSKRPDYIRRNSMREAGLWRKSLGEDLSALKDAYGAASMPASAILDTELVLTTMKNYFPGQDPHLAWTVFNGHPFPALEMLSDEAKRALLLTRLHLPWLMGRGAWLDHLERYKSLSSPYPLYRLDDWNIIDQANAVFPERR